MTKPPEFVADTACASRLEADVRALCAFGPRHTGDPESMELAAGWCAKRLGEAGWTVEAEPYKVADQTCVNLVAERLCDDPKAPWVVVGAHYDSVYLTPGADDNASAVALLLETAQRTAGLPLRRHLRFVAFANEEPPHFWTETMGSHIHAKAIKLRGDRVAAMICLESLGIFTDEKDSQAYPVPFFKTLYPSEGNFLAVVANLSSWRLGLSCRGSLRKSMQTPVRTCVVPSWFPGAALSDHCWFWKFGYPAVMLTDTAFLRSPHYHTPTDIPEYLNYPVMADVAAGLEQLIARLAGK